MQDYINLINFLKENDENIKKDLEELFYFVSITSFGENNRVNSKIFTFDYGQCKTENEAVGKSIKKIREDNVNMNNKIGIELYSGHRKELDYHHIMMYCENNKIKCSIFGVGYIVFKKRLKRIFLLDFDNTKPLHEQEPIVYKQLLDYFISIK